MLCQAHFVTWALVWFVQPNFVTFVTKSQWVTVWFARVAIRIFATRNSSVTRSVSLLRWRWAMRVLTWPRYPSRCISPYSPSLVSILTNWGGLVWSLNTFSSLVSAGLRMIQLTWSGAPTTGQLKVNLQNYSSHQTRYSSSIQIFGMEANSIFLKFSLDPWSLQTWRVECRLLEIMINKMRHSLRGE